jgi:excisionase family DNA binding protein
MAEAQDKTDYIDIVELSVRTGLSKSTLWRLKRAGRIPFYQPGGETCAVLFPPDAIEQATRPAASDHGHDHGSKQLSGPRPAWMNSNHSS